MSSRQLNHVYPTMVSSHVADGRLQGPIARRTTIRMEISSTMRVAVFWKNALGMLICEPPCTTPAAAEYLYIRIEYEFDRGVKIDARGLLDEMNLPENHVERKSILSQLTQLETHPYGPHQRKFSYTLGISKAELERYGGTVYLNDVDLVVGLDVYRDDVIHPFTAEGNNQSISALINKFEGFQQRYLLVDNRNEVTSRWVNTGYGVFELKPIVSPEHRDGVYVTTTEAVHKTPKTVHYEISDADTALGLYRTRAEAETFGKPETRFHAELKELEQNVTREKLEYQRKKQELEGEQRDADLRRKEFETEMEQRREKFSLEMEQQRTSLKMDADREAFSQENYTRRRKFDYDMDMQGRKERSEYLKGIIDVGKAVLAMASVGLSIYALAKKGK